MIKKLESLSLRFEEVNKIIQDPDLVKDPKRYKDIMREHSHLSAVMEAYKEYKSVLQGIEDSKILITEESDHEMKEMAREELKEIGSCYMDRADESWYFYLNEEEGWRLRVLDAAAGSRYYVMDHTKDGGASFQQIDLPWEQVLDI